jgi:hypothetical protein
VNYGEEKITFLSVVLNEGFSGWKPTDDTELHWTTANMIFKSNGINKSDIVKTEQHFNFSDDLYNSLKEKNEVNKEGFVLRYFPGNFRMKIKFEEYVRLHKIMTEVSTKSIWEILSNGNDMEDLLKDVPDEFYDKIKEYETELKTNYNKIETVCINRFNELKHLQKKEYAEEVKSHKYNSVLFSMYNGKPILPTIWKLIKPKFEKL